MCSGPGNSCWWNASEAKRQEQQEQLQKQREHKNKKKKDEGKATFGLPKISYPWRIYFYTISIVS